MKRFVLVAAVLSWTFLPASADAPGDSPQTIVRTRVEAAEMIRQPVRLHDPRYLTAPGPKPGDTFVALTAAVGGEGIHGIRQTWLYLVSGNHARRLFKFPMDAEALETGTESLPTISASTETSPSVEADATGTLEWPVVKGAYWVYDCLICSGPEGGYIYKVPVIAAAEKGVYRLRPAGAQLSRKLTEKESLRTIDNATLKYGKSRKELVQMRQEVERLFGRGLRAD